VTDRHEDSGRVRLSLPPEAITARGLGRAWRGYDRDAADDLLARLARQTAALVDEVEDLRAERRRLQDRLADVAGTEELLRRTLVTAQRTADESVREATARAEELRTRALGRAEELLREAVDESHDLRDRALRNARAEEAAVRERRRELEQHADALEAFARDHRDRLARHLRRQLERLDELELPTPPATVPRGTAADGPVEDVAGPEDLVGRGDGSGHDDGGERSGDDDVRVERMVAAVSEEVYGDTGPDREGESAGDADGPDAGPPPDDDESVRDRHADGSDGDGGDGDGGDAESADGDAEARDVG
jgi:cell division initiation protein